MDIPDFPLARAELTTGVALDYVDIGPRGAPVLMFLHGFPESHRTWRHQLAACADRYRCIAPDQRGYCGSDKPGGADAYTPDKLIADVFALADACGVSQFTVIGHDWGGAIAWGVALAGQPGGLYPHQSGRVTGAVIANAPHPHIFARLLASDPGQRAASQYMRAFRDPANDALVARGGLVALLAAAVKWDRSPALTDAERGRLMAGWEVPGAAMAMLNWYRASPIDAPPLDAPFEAAAPVLPGDFPALTLPTLVIWALDDLALPPANLDGLDVLVPDMTLVEVPGCGHFVPWEAPAAVNAALAAFLEGTLG